MKVSINDPCHENWDAMSPNEQGAFCLACQKTVVDFSQKTTQEIKDFFTLIPQTEKVCGRFRNDQLKQLSFDEFFVKFKNWILPKKFAVILFFCFGLTLFSCKTAQEPLMGAVAIETNTTQDSLISGVAQQVSDTLNEDNNQTSITEEKEFKMGEVMALPPETSSNSEIICVPPETADKEDYIKGKVKIDE